MRMLQRLILLLSLLLNDVSSAISEERYSRQTFTLGARAQGILRSPDTLMVLDGSGGLLYEISKNVALMGVRNLLVLEEQLDESTQDDLGRMVSSQEAGSPSSSLVEKLRGLNPTISVTGVSDQRSIWKHIRKYANTVYVSADTSRKDSLETSDMARKHKVKCIVAESRGVFGRILCDLGDSHTVVDPDGEAPVVVPLEKVEQDVSDTATTLIIHGVEKHDVSKGESVQFQAANGDVVATCIVQEVITPYRLRATVASPSFLQNVEQATTFQRIKTPVELKYKPIRKVLEQARTHHTTTDEIYTPSDLTKSFDTKRRNTIMAAFAAMPKFIHWNDFLKDVEQSIPSPDSALLKNLWHGRKTKFAPMQAILGAIVAQEAIKAITGVYTPIHQILLYDVDEVLTEGEELNPGDDVASSGLRTLLGDSVVDRLENAKVFVVGAGAIGCELLKNLAAMRVGAGNTGKVVVTDMDTIEASNLSRQLLFREADLGKFKSLAAKEAIERLNPAMKVEAHSSKVGDGDSSPFDEAFWSNLDIVLNALDNMEARLYMDGQCVAHRKALIDAGTMGPKGNVQVVVPFQSESYASSADPPEPAIPVCTIKNFPYAISHTIQWGKELFEELFQRRPTQANKVLDELESNDAKNVFCGIFRDNGAERAADIAKDVSVDIQASNNAKNCSQATSDSIEWAASLAHNMFYDASAKLLEQHPPDSKDEDGEPFWSGTRRAPKLLKFVKGPATAEEEQVNRNLIDFVRFATKLRLDTLLGEPHDCEPVEEASIVAALTTDIVRRDVDVNESATDSQPRPAKKILSALKAQEERLLPIDFEKDDETNGHVAFIAASSNLRAIAYGIPAVSVDETRRVAGRIIPAMVTTTALVSGLSCIELIKLVQAKELRKHRNAFVNLALPFFGFTSPVPADTMPGLQGRSYTLWDRVTIREGPISYSKGGISLKHVLKTIKEKVADDVEAVDVASISYGPFMIYANFLHDGDSDILDQKLWPLLRDVLAEENDSGYDPRAPYVDLDVVVEAADSEEAVELPPVRIYRYLDSVVSG